MDRKRVLIVDDDTTIVWTLGRNLARKGFYIVAVTDGEEGLQQLERDRFDFIVVDVQMQGVNGFVLLDHCRRYAPDAKTIVLINPGDSMMKEVSLVRGADLCVEKPVNIKFLVDTMSKGDTSESFTGIITHIDIFDYVQFVLFSRQQKVVEITSRTGRRGMIYIEQGNVVHAECSGKRGEEGFYHCLSFEGGSFSELPWQEPPERSVSVPGEFLVMEAARIKDELRKRKTAGTASI